jgi:Lysyl oxidase
MKRFSVLLVILLCGLFSGSSCSKKGTGPDAGGEGGEGGAGGEGGQGGSGPVDEGALIRVTTEAQVGVLLDEIPETMRERVASEILDKPESFFIARAKRQLALTQYRLNFRAYFYEEEEKFQLPLPPEEVLEVRLLPDNQGRKVRRATVEGHDYVLADYSLEAIVVTDFESPGISEPKLAKIGGEWDEPFVFPTDPELLVQRTGYACMDEAEFPPNSVDTEDPEFFYDHTCEVEPELTPDGCHYTELPEFSCEEALEKFVGRAPLKLHFERIAWDKSIADAARVGRVEAEGVADLDVVGEELSINRLTYRYIESDSCALAEACVGGTGWRRLLQFNASEKNVGTEPINIGDIDYFVDDPKNPTPNANHHVYVFSDCHGHYHFNYFARFTYGRDPDLGSKRAFCLESVARYGNHERSPTWSPYSTCYYQGISPGWGDQYNAGIECQWVDVTTVDTTDGPVTQALGLQSNPEGFLCEGKPVLGEDGFPEWEPTYLVTDEGEPVDRPVCDEKKGWDDNNYDELSVTLPLPGEGMVTEPCGRGQIGPRRNCGFEYDGKVISCSAGSKVRVTCSRAPGADPQVVRLCEGSHKLNAGVACVDKDALGVLVLTDDEAKSVTLDCPDARDADETGGLFAVYRGAVWPEDETATVTCTLD